MIKYEINILIIFIWFKGFYVDGIYVGLKEEKKDLGWLYFKVLVVVVGVYIIN